MAVMAGERLEMQSPAPAADRLLPSPSNREQALTSSKGRVRRLLYVSHFLAAWNSRAFEFGAFLFLATIYPDTLLPASVYALARNISAVLFSSSIGSYIDVAPRLVAVRHSIVGQRASVAVSCAILLLMTSQKDLAADRLASYGMLGILALLACVEKLSAVANTIAIERDWVVVVAQGDGDQLKKLNSQMRRIDLFCKLAAPLFVSIIDTVSTKIAIIVTAAIACLSVFAEYFAIARVFVAVPDLAVPRIIQERSLEHGRRSLMTLLKDRTAGLKVYFGHKAVLPSFSLSLLYLTVLSFNGQMITYLLAIGVSSGMIGLLRGVSALFELSATWAAPKVMDRIGPVRAGIWFLSWQIACVTAACVFFWYDGHPLLTAVGTISAVVLSRLGLWGFDLSAQIIVQEEVEAEHRGTFSSHEFAFQNAFEMLSFVSTIVFARPREFKYPASISALAVAAAGALYAAFVRHRRGHLVHLSQCMERNGKKTSHRDGRGWSAVAQDEDEDSNDA